MDDTNEIRYRIDSLQSIFLISISLAIDVIQALLDLFVIGGIINRIIGPFVWLFFLTWFYFLGIKFTKGGGKNMGTSIISMVIEMIPYIDLLPGWTVATIILIASSRQEDKAAALGKKTKSKKPGLKSVVPGAKQGKSSANPTKKSVVGSEVKTQDNNTKADTAQKELNATQTTGAKTAEQKTTEDNLETPKKEIEKDGQINKNKKEELDKKNNEEKQPGEEDRKDESYDTRTESYKKQQGKPEEQEDLAEFEDLPLQKEKKANPTPSEAEGGLNQQEFSMGDIYREPIEVPKKANSSGVKNDKKDDDLKMAA